MPCACAAISTKFPSFSNKDKTLIIQYVVKHEQNIDCVGGYMKLFPSTVDQQKLHGGADEVVTPAGVQKLVDKLKTQKHITIEHQVMDGANHFFENERDELMARINGYVDMRVKNDLSY